MSRQWFEKQCYDESSDLRADFFQLIMQIDYSINLHTYKFPHLTIEKAVLIPSNTFESLFS